MPYGYYKADELVTEGRNLIRRGTERLQQAQALIPTSPVLDNMMKVTQNLGKVRGILQNTDIRSGNSSDPDTLVLFKGGVDKITEAHLPTILKKEVSRPHKTCHCGLSFETSATLTSHQSSMHSTEWRCSFMQPSEDPQGEPTQCEKRSVFTKNLY